MRPARKWVGFGHTFSAGSSGSGPARFFDKKPRHGLPRFEKIGYISIGSKNGPKIPGFGVYFLAQALAQLDP